MFSTHSMFNSGLVKVELSLHWSATIKVIWSITSKIERQKALPEKGGPCLMNIKDTPDLGGGWKGRERERGDFGIFVSAFSALLFRRSDLNPINRLHFKLVSFLWHFLLKSLHNIYSTLINWQYWWPCSTFILIGTWPHLHLQKWRNS